MPVTAERARCGDRRQPPLVFHLNVNGLGARLEEVVQATRGVAIISLQDTRIRRDSDVWRTHWPLYSIFEFRHDDDGPGCALLVLSAMKHRLLLRRTEDRHRLLAAEIVLHDGLKLTVGSLYVPPRSNADGSVLRQDFLDAVLCSRQAVLVGDLNARSRELGCRSTNTNGTALVAYIDTSGAVVLNAPSIPTFDHNSVNFRDCLDWALASPPTSALLSCSIGEDCGSDHLPLLVSRPRTVAPSVHDAALPRWRTSGNDWPRPFARTLEANIGPLLDAPAPRSPQEIEDLAEAVEEAISSSADACLRRSNHRPNSSGLPLPWWVKLLIDQRRRLRRRLGRDAASDTETRQQLAALRKQIRWEVQKARQDRIQAKAAVFSQGPRQPSFWIEVKRWFRGQHQQVPPLRDEDADAEVRSPQQRAEVFAKHLRQALSVPQHTDFHQDFFRQVEEDVSDDPLFRPTWFADDEVDEVDPAEPTAPVPPSVVARELRNLRGGRAPGPDGVSTDLLKAAPFALALVLATLFSASLRLGYLPTRWRRSVARMLPKPGKLLSKPADYRPIALTSCLAKVLERLFARRLQRWCEARSLLPEEQSGFRYGRDALEQSTLLAQRAVEACNGGMVTAVAALDVSKAYDSVWHAGLLFSCREVLSQPSCRWIAAFLHDRSVAVLEEGCLSAPFPAPAGVPQGSPLSPLLYVLYTRTMPLPRREFCGATAYADDVALWATAQSPAAAWTMLRPSLDALRTWGLQWRLTFSAEKTQAAFFSRRQGGWTPDQIGVPSFGRVQLEWQSSLDLLGVRMDRRLKMLGHARRVIQKAAPRILELRRLMWTHRGIPTWIGLLLYRCMVRPCLTFAAPVLSLACDSARIKLQRTDRNGLRAALRLAKDSASRDLRQRTRALGTLQQEIRRSASSFLSRHVRAGNRRLLSGFVPEVDQLNDRVHISGPLERCLAWSRQLNHHELSTRIRRILPPPTRQLHPGRSTRARYAEAEDWGVSPFDTGTTRSSRRRRLSDSSISSASDGGSDGSIP